MEFCLGKTPKLSGIAGQLACGVWFVNQTDGTRTKVAENLAVAARMPPVFKATLSQSESV
ncbi:MAG: hypothetical protein LBG72_01960 [Spirochaetaceae bacterium]|jgi:hypothetical protein|nr:hypothetical protein [Spirochaetaceae bacterium]